MIYFASDVHLGGGDELTAHTTEQRFCAWLDMIASDAEVVVLHGDIFDFWFEYKRVVPKGFVRSLARLAALTDRGVRVLLFTGNHDMWMRDYLERECGVELHFAPERLMLGGKKIHIAHGDNLKIRREPLLKLMNATFRSTLIRKIFSAIVHPDVALKFGLWWSNSSRKKHIDNNFAHLDEQCAALVEYALECEREQRCDYYIYGHLHLAKEIEAEGTKIIFTNDWSGEPHYAQLDTEGNITLRKA